MRRKKLAWLEGWTHLASPLKKRQDSQALVVSVGMKFHPFMKILWLSGVDPATPLPPLFLDQTENNFSRDRSFPPPPPPLSKGLDLRLTLNGKSVLILLLGLIICIVWMQRETEKCKFLSFLVGCHQFSFFKFCFEAQAQFSVNRWIPGTALLHCLNHLLASIFLIVVL